MSHSEVYVKLAIKIPGGVVRRLCFERKEGEHKIIQGKSEAVGAWVLEGEAPWAGPLLGAMCGRGGCSSQATRCENPENK